MQNIRNAIMSTGTARTPYIVSLVINSIFSTVANSKDEKERKQKHT